MVTNKNGGSRIDGKQSERRSFRCSKSKLSGNRADETTKKKSNGWKLVFSAKPQSVQIVQ